MSRILGLFLILVTFSQAFEEGYEIHDNVNMLYKFHKTPKTWYEASRICRNENARLAMPANFQEASVLTSILKRFVPDEESGKFRYMFLGFHDLFNEGEYITEEDTSIQNYFHSWMNFQPDNANAAEHCGSLGRFGTLNDFSCHAAVFTCQRKYRERSSSFETCNGCLTGHIHNWKISYFDALYSKRELDESKSTATICEDSVNILLSYTQNGVATSKLSNGYHFVPKLNKLYKLHLSIKSWTEARTICEAENAHLAVIDSDEEKEYLVNMLNEPGNTVHNAQMKNYTFIGFHNFFNTGVFLDIKGEKILKPVITRAPKGTSGSLYNCGSLELSSGDMIGIPCQNKATFFCEKETFTYSFYNIG